MIRKQFIFLLCWFVLILGKTNAYAQQLSQYSQWSFNQFAINPALAGIKNCLDVKTGYRLQWAGFEGAPQSGLFTINAPLNKKQKKYNSSFHGIGAKVERDVMGAFQHFSLALSYALHFPIENDRRLSFGLGGGIQQMSFDQTQVTTIDPDLAVAQSANLFMAPLINSGAWYNTKNWYVGYSFDQLARNRWENIGFDSRFQIHQLLTAGAKIGLENDIALLPALLLRIPPRGPASLDLNLMVDFQDRFSAGLGFRNTDALIAIIRIKLERVVIGYSFDYITSSIQGGNFHTHEIAISYNTCRIRNTSSSSCPLFE